MSMTESTLQPLRRLIEQDADLRSRLQEATSSAAAAALLIAAASQNGLAIQVEDLHAHFAAQVRAASPSQALDDEALDQVAGGLSYAERQALSFFSLGLACLGSGSGGRGGGTPNGRPL